ncbi:hypothetical protein [Curtobacterium flaccumfaciens]|uniref:hypothetical protein n=1 Tax=Curtobacterium flaccumfaciens TaxID=2035 RepID=UPI0015FFA31E|nr:hypothetical protein [Curtobacterium flaccumfaciens]MBB1195755.1 hypothetical protein [Curtobacterium flaccumfaciens]
MTNTQDISDRPFAKLPLPPVLESPSEVRLHVIRLAPTGLFALSWFAMCFGIVERVNAVAPARDLPSLIAALGGFPIMLGLIGAVFVTLAMRQRTRARRERARFRAEARWDPCELPSDVRRLDERGRRLRRGFRSSHRAQVASIARSFGEARAAAASSYERYGNVSLCAAAVLALIGWLAG